MRRLLALLLLAAGLAPSCQVVEAHTHNLRELHEEDGHHKRRARVLSGTQYMMRYGIASLFRRDRGAIDPPAEVKIDDPLEECVGNLLDLAHFDSSREGIAAMQVEHFARFARLDPWRISRQICLDELGKAGARLDLARHPPGPEPQGDAATPEGLRDVLSPLIQALDRRVAPPSPEAIAEACRAVAALKYDHEGILRALAVSGALLNRSSAGSEIHAPLLELVQDLERRTVRMALEHGVGDRDPHVRAAALQAGVRALGVDYLAQSIPRMVSDPEPVVALAILADLRDSGLPPAAPSADPAQSSREGELAIVYRVATEHPSERVRVSAMAALGEVSGAGFHSLREEDWQSWWVARTAPAAP